MKLVGCLLIVYASTMTGHAIGQYHMRMVRELEEILLFIRILKGQISYAAIELPELLEESENRLNGAVREWIHMLTRRLVERCDTPFAELWGDSMADLERLSALKKDVISDVDMLGRILGDMDIEAQISQIELVENILNDRYERARERSVRTNRLANYLGILGGVFIVIMLI